MKHLVIIALVLMVFTVNAQEDAAVRKLTFQDAVSIALKNNITLGQQRNLLGASQMQRTASVMTAAPSVNLNGFVQQFNGNSFNQQQGRAVNGVRDAFNGSLNATMPIFNGFNIVNTARQASSQLDAQTYFVKRTTEDVINTVSGQYLQVLLDIELLKIAKENFEALEVQLVQIKEQVVVGSRSPVDQYNQEGQVKGAELRMLQAEINLTNDRATLTQTLLLDPFMEIEIEKPNWTISEMELIDPNIDEMYAIAQVNRGDLQRAIKNEDAARFGMKATRGLMTPSIGAFFNYGSAYNYQHDVADLITIPNSTPIVVFDPSTPTGYAIDYSNNTTELPNPAVPRSFSDQFRNDNVYKSYGLQMTIPILNGFQTRNRTMQQKITYRNNQLVKDNAVIQVKTDVLRAARNFQIGKKAYTVSDAQLVAAQMAFQLESERYSLGVTNFVDFAQANRTLVLAQTEKAQAEFRLIFQKVLLEYATGTLKIEGIQY